MPSTSCRLLSSPQIYSRLFLLSAFFPAFKFLTCNTADARHTTPDTHSTVRNDTSLMAWKSTRFGHPSLSSSPPSSNGDEFCFS